MLPQLNLHDTSEVHEMTQNGTSNCQRHGTDLSKKEQLLLILRSQFYSKHAVTKTWTS